MRTLVRLHDALLDLEMLALPQDFANRAVHALCYSMVTCSSPLFALCVFLDSLHVTGKEQRRGSAASTTASGPDQRHPGPAPGSSDYFRRYLGGRRALSAHAGAPARPSAAQRPSKSTTPGRRQSGSPAFTAREQNKAKRLIGQTMSTSQSSSKKEVRLCCVDQHLISAALVCLSPLCHFTGHDAAKMDTRIF